MRRSDRNNAFCFENLESSLAENPETYGHIDLLCGGWPCQDNSIAGNRAGLEGEKSGLWKDLARMLRIFNPRWFIGENVPGFLSVNAGQDFCSVIAELQDIGYGISWRILDSKYFGVPQQRRRLFIVGYFGNTCPPEILFEAQSDTRNNPSKQEVGSFGLCLSTRDGQRQDPSTENIVAFCLGTDLRGQPYKLHTESLVAGTVTAKETQMYSGKARGKANLIANTTTVRTQEAGNRIQGNIATTIDPNREGTLTGLPPQLDGSRGVVIGNAVTIPIVEWIGKRIMEYENTTAPAIDNNELELRIGNY